MTLERSLLEHEIRMSGKLWFPFEMQAKLINSKGRYLAKKGLDRPNSRACKHLGPQGQLESCWSVM